MDKKRILVLLVERDFNELNRMLREENPADIAELIADLPTGLIPLVFRVLPKELAADTFVEMDTEQQKQLIDAFSDLELQTVLSQVFVDDTVNLIEEMPANVVRRILASCSADKRKQINQILSYPADSAGSVMTTEFVDLHPNMTVAEAFDHIRKTGINKETIYTCYVTSEARLVGVIDAKTLLLSSPEACINDLMETNVIKAETTTPKTEAAHLIEKYDLLAVPVVDTENRFVGILTVDDAIDLLSEAAEDDFAKMAAVAPPPDAYLRSSVWTQYKSRIVWLLILMLSGTLSGALLTKYETAFAAIPLLVAFIPMLMDTGGNSGSQSSTMIIRGLATGEITTHDFFKVLFKEFRIGVMIGLTLAVVNFGRMMLMYRGIEQWVSIAIVSGLALMCAVIIAKMLGCILPMLAKKLRLDPALMASPMLTTVCDACSILIYFNIAVFVLKL